MTFEEADRVEAQTIRLSQATTLTLLMAQRGVEELGEQPSSEVLHLLADLLRDIGGKLDTIQNDGRRAEAGL